MVRTVAEVCSVWLNGNWEAIKTMDVNLKVSALEKLLDYTVSGIGAIAGPMLANWKASREGKARLTSTRADAEVRRIETESKARSLKIIADAQAKARRSIDTTIEPGHGIMVEITRDDITQSIEFQGRKRLTNARSVVEDAADELDDKEVPDHEPDPDWAARFFNDIQDVSSEEMQSLWAKVLAGEVERPGSTSIRTLSILRNLDQTAARLFGKLCSACVSLRLDGHQVIDARVPSLGGTAANNSLKKYGLDFVNLNVLNEHGLISSDYNSWRDYKVSIGDPFTRTFRRAYFAFPSVFRDDIGFFHRRPSATQTESSGISGVALTQSGRELLRVVGLEPMNRVHSSPNRVFSNEESENDRG